MDQFPGTDMPDKPPIKPPETFMPDAESMVAFTSNEDNKRLSDEVEEHKAAIPAATKPSLSVEDLGF